MIVQAQSHCILPCYQNVCDVYLRNKHLVAPEGLYEHPVVMACNAYGIDHKASTNEIAAEFYSRFVAVVLNLKVLVRRWEAGDTSILQPADPNPMMLLYFVNGAMMAMTGQKEMVTDVCR